MSDSGRAAPTDGSALRPCSFCGQARTDTEEVTVTDTSGGASARMCASCRAFATATRCGLCGRVKSEHEKADALHFGLGDPDRSDGAAPICDRCRDRMLFPPGEVR